MIAAHGKTTEKKALTHFAILLTAMSDVFTAILTADLLQHCHCKLTCKGKTTLLVIVALQVIWDGAIIADTTIYQLFCSCNSTATMPAAEL